jgi:DNA-binding NtrC family response regulator
MTSIMGRETTGFVQQSDRAQRRARLERDIADLLIGDSAVMRELRTMIVRFAPTALPVLIQGPTGSGKELVARALHIASGRDGAFVALNVCAVSDTMFEDALFGHVRGAFTGAAGDTAGYLAEANGGSVFLDEISGLSMQSQAKLLRAVETGVYRQVGAARDRLSDFRIVAASNEDVTALTAAGRFRGDLMHRLRGVVLHVPPLCARPEDIGGLARYFASSNTCGARSQIDDGAIRRLERHDWPGNVRELKHVVEHVSVLADGGTVTRQAVEQVIGCRDRAALDEHEFFSRARFRALLEECGWDTRCAAARLGVNRATIYRRMERLGLKTPVRKALFSVTL